MGSVAIKLFFVALMRAHGRTGDKVFWGEQSGAVLHKKVARAFGQKVPGIGNVVDLGGFPPSSRRVGRPSTSESMFSFAKGGEFPSFRVLKACITTGVSGLCDHEVGDPSPRFLSTS